MSETQKLSLKSKDLLKAKNNWSLNPDQIKFILIWNDIVTGFGFNEDVREEDRFKEAISLLKEIEIEWQDRIRNNNTNLSFPKYFHFLGVSEGLNLSVDFGDKLEEKLKGDIK